jgi:Suppressor of fused protein (SUFU)
MPSLRILAGKECITNEHLQVEMDLDEYRKQFSGPDDAPGWDAISAELEKLYSAQEPKHFAAVPHFSLGGDDPLDGISIYESVAGGTQHYHFVTYGFSELYVNEDAVGKEFSKFGFELTFRLKPFPGDEGLPHWAVTLLQNVARYVFKSGKWFEPYHVMTARGPIRLETETAIRALLFVPDPELPPIQTVHGRVEFLQVFGITEQEWKDCEGLLEKTEALAARHRLDNPYLVTDLER